jgi:hypothetical protein
MNVCAHYVFRFASETRLKMKSSEESGYTRHEDVVMELLAQIDMNGTRHCALGMKPLSFFSSKFRQMLQW